MKLRKALVSVTCILCTSSAMAASYSIRANYESDMCSAVRDAFAHGMVLDAERPLCERRFELSPKAKSLGLENVEKRLLPASSYPDLLRKVVRIAGYEKGPQSAAVRDHDEKIIVRLMSDYSIKFFASNFDADNSGEVQNVYINDLTICHPSNSYADGSVTTYIQKGDGSFDPMWGVHDATAGIPFIYDRHTHYMKWKSLNGSSNKNMLAEIDVYDVLPYRGLLRTVTPYSGFAPPDCIIYQTKRRMLL